MPKAIAHWFNNPDIPLILYFYRMHLIHVFQCVWFVWTSLRCKKGKASKIIQHYTRALSTGFKITNFLTTDWITQVIITWPLCFCRRLVLGLYKEDYLQILKMCVLLITQLLRLMGKLGSRKPVKPHQLDSYRYPNWLSKVSPQSLCNRSFGGILMFSRCFFIFSVGVRAFATGLSQISHLSFYKSQA